MDLALAALGPEPTLDERCEFEYMATYTMEAECNVSLFKLGVEAKLLFWDIFETFVTPEDKKKMENGKEWMKRWDRIEKEAHQVAGDQEGTQRLWNCLIILSGEASEDARPMRKQPRNSHLLQMLCVKKRKWPRNSIHAVRTCKYTTD